MEPLDLAFVGKPGVPEDQAGDEDGEEPRPACERSRAVERAGEREREDGVEPLAREREPAQQREEQEAAGDADGGADRHLDDELPDDDEARRVSVRRELDHPDHERDPRGVVHPRLALQDRAGAPPDLPPAED